jgi:hypothetical protein
MQLAKEQFGLAAAQAAADEQYRQQAFEAETSAASNAAASQASGDRVKMYGLNLPAKQAGLVREGIGAWRKGNKRTLGSFLANVTQSSGLSRAMAARIAMNSFSPAELKKYAGSRKAFMRAMSGSGVSERVARAWAVRVFGAAPADVVAFHANRPGVTRPTTHGGSSISIDPSSGGTHTGQA